MDIFAHGLWTGAAATAVNKKLKAKNKKTLNVWLTTFWGVFPDLFAFAIPFAWITSGILTGALHFSDIPRPHEIEGPTSKVYWVIHLAQQLYNISHSGVVFAAVFLLAWAFARRPVYEMLGWLMHLLIDIPTHSLQFYPTPIFWPISNWVFAYGIAWSQWWFQIINYSTLIAVYIWLWRENKKTAS